MADPAKTPEQARVDLIQGTIDDITSYLLDHCPDDVMWEDFDPELDDIRSQLQELQEDGS